MYEKENIDLPPFDAFALVLVAGVHCRVVSTAVWLGIQPELKGSDADIGWTAISGGDMRFRIAKEQ
jgi:hypothetical protein